MWLRGSKPVIQGPRQKASGIGWAENTRPLLSEPQRTRMSALAEQSLSCLMPPLTYWVLPVCQARRGYAAALRRLVLYVI